MPPLVLAGTEDALPPGVAISGLYLVASLEAVLSDSSDTPNILLRLHSYPKDPAREGYWAPPNLQYRVDGNSEPPQDPRELMQEFDAYRSTHRTAIQQSMVLFAESFGLRGVELVQVKQNPQIEVKPSINEPNILNAFYTLRYTLRRVSRGTEANLVDREVRHGFVTFPLETRNGGNGTASPLLALEANEHGEFQYLGKPLISSLQRTLDDQSELSRLRQTAIKVPNLSTVRRESGLIAVADFAGYGAILNGSFTGMFNDPDSDRREYQAKVLGTLERSLTNPGTTQVQTVGDGFVAAYPITNELPQLSRKLMNVVAKWTDTVRIVDSDLNGSLAKANNLRRLGSRMAITYGSYEWGRINGLESFSPAFAGAAVVEAARLEQALNAYMSKRVARGSLDENAHLIALNGSLASVADMHRVALKDLGWQLRRPAKLKAKEVAFVGTRIYEWRSPEHVR